MSEGGAGSNPDGWGCQGVDDAPRVTLPLCVPLGLNDFPRLIPVKVGLIFDDLLIR